MKVYLSYSRDTARLADRLANSLQRHNLTTLYDRERLPASSMSPSPLDEYLGSADAYVFLIGSQRGPWLEREWSRAVEEVWSHPDRKMIPVVVADAALPPFLRGRQAILLRKDARDWDKAVRLLVSALRGKASHGELRRPALRKQQRQRIQVLEKQASELEPTPEDLRRRARGLEEQLDRQLGTNDPESAQTAARLADLMKSLKQPKKALHYLQISLDSLERRDDGLSSAAARTHANMAMVLRGLNQHREARKHLENAIRIYRRAEGPEAMTVGLTEMQLATLLDQLGESRAARSHRQAGKEVMKKAALNFLENVPILGSIISQVKKVLVRKGTQHPQSSRRVPKIKATGRARKPKKRTPAKRKGAPQKSKRQHSTLKRATTRKKEGKKAPRRRKVDQRRRPKKEGR